MTIDELAKRCKGSVTLSINDHRDTYESLHGYLKRMHDEAWQSCPPKIADDLEGPDLYELTFYPHTPIGSYCVIGSRYGAVMMAAREIMEGLGL